MRIVPINQIAIDVSTHNMRKISNQVIGYHQQIVDLLSRDDIKKNRLVEMYLTMSKQNVEVLYSNVNVAFQHIETNFNRFMRELDLGQIKLL